MGIKTHPDAEEREALRRSLLLSRTFSASAKAVLDYLFQRHETNPLEAPAEKEIFMFCFRDRLAPAYDSNRVRVIIARLRTTLSAYFDHDPEGRSQRFKIDIGRRRYTLHFSSNTPPPGDDVRRFWLPYCDSAIETLILLSQPVFLRATKTLYLRDLEANDRTRLHDAEVSQKFETTATLAPSHHYVSAGEVFAAFQLMRCLKDRSASIDSATVAHRPTLSGMDNEHLILLGSENANHLILRFQQGHRFHVGPGCVRVLDPTGAEELVYADNSEDGGSGFGMDTYAVLTRMPSPLNPSHTVTLIAANHGRAVQGVATILTQQRRVQEIMDLIGGSEVVPQHFQILFRVGVILERGEAEIASVIAIGSHVYP